MTNRWKLIVGAVLVAVMFFAFMMGVIAVFDALERQDREWYEREVANHHAQIEACAERDGQVVLSEHGWFKQCIYTPEEK